MSPSACSTVLLLLAASVLLLSTAPVSAHNITRILEQYPDFSKFNALLSQTHLASEINRRKAVTILALTNDHLGGALDGKPEDLQKRILSTHVILDYYDVLKLNKLKGNRTILTTLYQSTGIADDQQGFLDIAHNKDGIFFGSAMRGAAVDSKLEGSVATQPYNISVLSVSHLIVAPGIDGSYRPEAAPPPPEAAAAPKVPAPAESPEDDVPADAPADDDSEAPAPAADAPGLDAAPADDANEQSAPPSSGAGRKVVKSGVVVGVMVALVSLVHY